MYTGTMSACSSRNKVKKRVCTYAPIWFHCVMSNYARRVILASSKQSLADIPVKMANLVYIREAMLCRGKCT